MHALLLLLAVSTANPNPQAKATAVKPLPYGVVQVTVGTLHCPSCAQQVARNLYKTPGVMRVRTDMKQNQIWITVQPNKKVDLVQVWNATKLKDVQPVSVRVGAKKYLAKDFEQSAATKQTAGGQPSTNAKQSVAAEQRTSRTR
ncbi:MAG: heavy-metal-associated domain-containing protein [Planctomycetales bacterium]|nr:heavy-metal-associated domain-containing protein [Planctomycetales bacterium]